MAAPKKDFRKGIDKLFSGADAQQAKEAQVTQEAVTQQAEEAQVAQEVQKTHKAEQVSEAQIAQDVKDMSAQLDAQEARKTAGRKGFKMQRLNISLTPSEFEYVRIMSAISGKSQTRFIGDLVSADAKRNAEAYQKAREIIENTRT